MRTVYTKHGEVAGLGKTGDPVVETTMYSLAYLALHGYSTDVEDETKPEVSRAKSNDGRSKVETGAMASPEKVKP